MFKNKQESSSNSASSSTDKNNVSKTEYELARIFKAQSMRVMTICANFSALGTCRMERPQELSIVDIPPASFSQVPATIMSQMIDTGRANSGLPNYVKHGTSFFHDTYHREAFFDKNVYFSLAESSCVISTTEPEMKLIPVVRNFFPIIYRYFLVKSQGQNIYTFIRYDLPTDHLGTTEQICLLKIPDKQVHDILHDLGMLGALPNRDWQLKYYEQRYDSLIEIRDFYCNMMSLQYGAKFPKRYKTTRIPDSHCSYKDQKRSLLTLLNQQNDSYHSGLKEEQRLFYSQFLTKLISTISIDETTSDLQFQLQSSLSLQRIEKMLKKCTEISYSSFLRTIEACIDEVSILLTLERSQKPKSALKIAEVAKQFITDTVGITPQMTTLRTSAMQAIWSALDMALTFFNDNATGKAITIFIPHTIYFEVANVLKILFNLPLYQPEQDLSIDISSDIFSADFVGKEIPYSPDVIYDLYIASFESNIQIKKNKIEFIDINSFVENQFRLRREAQENEKPLIVIIDNTMSDFDDVYLPFFLMEFNEEIISGKLCVLISHSGNKYLHLGTDKALAALMYGYYNPSYFIKMNTLINQELEYGNLGDFNTDSPTVLLTEAFLKHGKEEILTFSPLIRQRTRHIFNTIPAELVSKPNYFTIVNPVSNATYKNLPTSCDILKNNCGFIIIKCDRNRFFEGDIHDKIFNNLNKILIDSGIKGRDGFGFNQTTKVLIRMPGYSDAIRISIGTESLDDIIAAMQLVCDHLVAINTIMEGYRNTSQTSKVSLNAGNPYFTHLFDAIETTYQHAMEQLSRTKEDSNNHAQYSM